MTMDIDVPDGESGDWKVDTFTVSEEKARSINMRATSFSVGGRTAQPGTYKRLSYAGNIIMTNTPSELRDFSYFVHRATGRVLMNGLGLGVTLKAVLEKPEVTAAIIIEKSTDVIDLVANTYNKDPRVSIIEADAFEYKPPKGVRYDCVWHDVWPDITATNLPH